MSGVLIVTGGSRGIGAATAKLAAERGYDVCVNYRSDAEAAAEVARSVEAAGRQALAVQADVAREAEVVKLFETAEQSLGPITALVNNAGLAGQVDRLVDAPSERIQTVVDTNVYGVIWPCREAVKRMSTRLGGKGGAIVNVSSGAATIGSPGQYVWYAAAKGAVDSFTLGLSKEAAAEGIRVNAVAPGFVKTRIHADSGMPNRIEEDAPKVPIARAAETEEIAEPILWLLSDAASYTTGAILRVAGGR